MRIHFILACFVEDDIVAELLHLHGQTHAFVESAGCRRDGDGVCSRRGRGVVGQWSRSSRPEYSTAVSASADATDQTGQKDDDRQPAQGHC